MIEAMKPLIGKAVTVTGPIEPAVLGKVMMHEHLQCDIYDWEKDELITAEKPASSGRRKFLLGNAVPALKAARERYGLGAYCDVSMPPWRGWPDLYAEVSLASGVRIVMATGFYRELEVGKYWAKTPDRAIWPFVREATVEQLAEMCVREISESIHGTGIRAGCIKLGSSAAQLTAAEAKAFRAGARAQVATGVHITTHCTGWGAETSQLKLLEEEGVDVRRVVVGHTAWHVTDKGSRKGVIEWMKRGANFLPTNLDVRNPHQWQGLIDAIHDIFQAGHGDKLVLGLDSGYCSESGPFGPMTFMPPPPWGYMFSDTLPAFRKMGLTAEEEDWMMRRNPQRVIPVQ